MVSKLKSEQKRREGKSDHLNDFIIIISGSVLILEEKNKTLENRNMEIWNGKFDNGKVWKMEKNGKLKN